ncbi:MAG: CPBP family intramembrane metalloprotease [Deltaproteobacteria bacterium]|nr:CPBP family intramembrane metalloprotease [Deltaproteobacteria bacterium]
MALAAIAASRLIQQNVEPTSKALTAEYLKLALSPEGFAATSGGFEIGLLLLTFLAVALGPRPLRTRLRLNAPPWPPRSKGVLYLLVALTFLAFSEAEELALACVAGGLSEALAATARVYRETEGPMFFGLVLVMGVLGPVAEELFFRGYVQSRLVDRWGAWVGIGLSALLFALIHIDPMLIVSAAGAGVILGLLFLRTGSVRVTIVAHAANNMLYALGVLPGADDLTSGAALVVGVLSTLVFAVGFAAIMRLTPALTPAQSRVIGVA